MHRHQHLINTTNGVRGEGPTCTLCEDGEMSSQHVVAECGALADLRQKYFDTVYLTPPFYNLKMKALIGFLREAPIDELQFFLESE